MAEVNEAFWWLLITVFIISNVPLKKKEVNQQNVEAVSCICTRCYSFCHSLLGNMLWDFYILPPFPFISFQITVYIVPSFCPPLLELRLIHFLLLIFSFLCFWFYTNYLQAKSNSTSQKLSTRINFQSGNVSF